MKKETTYILGLGSVICGVILIVLNAVDYLAGWSVLPEGLLVICLVLVAVGQIIAAKSKK
jgi:hypothetical protein